MPDHVLDARGLYCPEPVMLLHTRVRDMQPGEVVTVHATDPTTRCDIERFCHFLGHALLASEEHDGEFLFRVQKRADPPVERALPAIDAS